MKIVVAAFLDAKQWQAPSSFRRTSKMVDVIVFERPNIGDTVEGKLAELYDPDSYTARMKAAAEQFGGDAFLAIGERTPPGRPE